MFDRSRFSSCFTLRVLFPTNYSAFVLVHLQREREREWEEKRKRERSFWLHCLPRCCPVSRALIVPILQLLEEGIALIVLGQDVFPENSLPLPLSLCAISTIRFVSNRFLYSVAAFAFVPFCFFTSFPTAYCHFFHISVVIFNGTLPTHCPPPPPPPTTCGKCGNRF